MIIKKGKTMARKVKIVMEFTATMDMFPGFGFTIESWEQYCIDRMKGNEHYDTTCEVVHSEEIPRVFYKGKWRGMDELTRSERRDWISNYDVTQ